MRGWIKMHRNLLNSELWDSLTPGECKAMIAILLSTEYDTLLLSRASIATAYNISRSVVNSTFSKLLKYEYLVQIDEAYKVNFERFSDRDLITKRSDVIIKRSAPDHLMISSPYIEKLRNRETRDPTTITSTTTKTTSTSKQYKLVSDTPASKQMQVAATELVHYYRDNFQRKFDFKPQPDHNKDYNTALKLLTDRNLDECKTLVNKYLDYDNDWIRERGYLFTLLPSQVQSLLMPQKSNDIMQGMERLLPDDE